MDVAFIEDIAEKYSEKRKNKVSKEEAEDLLKIIFKYIGNKLETDDFYALSLADFGVLYKYHELEEVLDIGNPVTKEKKLMDKELLNKLYSINVKPIYKYNEIELLTENTNNHPIKK